MKIAFNKFLLLFRFCHIKYFSNGSDSDTLDFSFKLLGDSVTVSHDVINSTLLSAASIKYINLQHVSQRVKRYSYCYLHCYIVNQVITYMPKILASLKFVTERPDYYLFFEDKPLCQQPRVKNQFYLLWRKVALGPVFIVKMQSEIAIVCQSCRDTLHFPTAKEYTSLNAIHKYWLSLHSNLNQVKILSDINYLTRDMKFWCQNFSKKFSHAILFDTNPEVCIHVILSEKLNYTVTWLTTYRKKSTSIKSIHGSATLGTYIGKESVYLKDKRNAWTPYAVQFSRFYYISLGKTTFSPFILCGAI